MADDPAIEILDATYRALCKHGYANLTLQDIAAEADTSKSSIHYHYDSKDQLFVPFLDDLYERFTGRVDSPEGDTPYEQLQEILAVGVDNGGFDDDIKPARDAEFLATTITGAQTRHVTINQSSDQLYDTMSRYIERHLLADEQPEVGR